MSPIYFNIDDHLPVMVVPNVKVLMDGHPVLTYSYNIFYNSKHQAPKQAPDDPAILQDKLSNPDYYGCLAFEDPERLFSFTPDGMRQLTRHELEEIVERVKHYRDNPHLWRNDN